MESGARQARRRGGRTARERVLILDFGSQYTQLIARRVREAGVFSEIVPGTTSASEIAARDPSALILSGSPASGYRAEAPLPDAGIYALDKPLLGICYGFQVTAQLTGGQVAKAAAAEYGTATFVVDRPSPLFAGVPRRFRAWMSHGDEVQALGEGWVPVAHTANARFAAARHARRPFHLIQFHPEVVHSTYGKRVLQNFLFRIAGLKGGWSMKGFLEQAVADIRARVKQGHIVCGLSGGVDSTVVATLCHRAVGRRLQCVLVDHGLLRLGEAEEVARELGEKRRLQLTVVDARARFLDRLAGVSDPERKRRIIGAEFIAVFEEEARRHGPVEFLAQGTLYPDVIESASAGHGAQVIKTHHNVGGLPERMNLKLIEPLRLLFKDEVRALGRALGLPDHLVDRHPFPGPGLAVRTLGAVNAADLEILRKADAIFIEELRRSNWYHRTWQAFAVLLPVSTVGVKGDERSYERVIALRAVHSEDGMTADWTRLPASLLARASSRIANEVRGVNRVVYDCTSKPPATIEWE
ncbi:MAG: glutamine-hydrolyzing GMP synthase [Candidatus Eisenbacteria bacterium]|uniref:GMP synthase [glutamine-hydrolyzing] n=1 Tax=Eiseniibacteriota bacterium TaxID=2212470 RepID=A0A538TLD7_UNCEI|nr:MAG: glutamine-hydrolyzing GMP synthase [Candidatus Eisenbacteria bacterium]